MEKYLESFEIIDQASTYSFMIDLPKSICTVHSVFYMSMLKPTMLNIFSSWSKPSLPLVMIYGKLEYEVSQIIDSKIDHRHACKLLYKVIWLEYKNTEEESDWLSTSELAYTLDLIFNFHQAYSNKASLFVVATTKHRVQ